MSAQFYQKLSQNLTDLLENGEYYDITIEVEKDSKVQIFRAHSAIISYRSPYIREILSINSRSEDTTISRRIKLSNISPNSFQTILKYIYGGVLVLDESNVLCILDLLEDVAVLLLQELVNYLQKYLIDHFYDQLKLYFDRIHFMSFKHESLVELQKFCTEIMIKNPQIIQSLELKSMPENSLIQLIKRDDLKMEEIQVWKYLIKWGLTQNPNVVADVESWSDDDFNAMKKTLELSLSHIRYFQFSSKQFLKKVHPYENILNDQLFNDLISYYLDPSNNSDKSNIPRKGNIDSNIITSRHAAMISSWINCNQRLECVHEYTNHYEIEENPYKFTLLLRGSRDGFTPRAFHRLCDFIAGTVVICKVHGTDEILGGYNSHIWKSVPGWERTEKSFIFSFKGKDLTNITLSYPTNSCHAIEYDEKLGPTFGQNDLRIEGVDFNVSSVSSCKLSDYNKNIRDTEARFSLDEFEVFQIIEIIKYV